ARGAAPHSRSLVFPYSTLFRSAAAWLHDVLEDTTVTEAQLRESFPDEVVDAVAAVTKHPGESLETYFERVRAVPAAILVKKADLDRKSTRLNSSHVSISYAVFC